MIDVSVNIDDDLNSKDFFKFKNLEIFKTQILKIYNLPRFLKFSKPLN